MILDFSKRLCRSIEAASDRFRAMMSLKLVPAETFDADPNRPSPSPPRPPAVPSVLGVIAVFDKRKWGHFDEHSMFAIMEGLRDRFPQKLSHAGPRKFAYHKLS